MCIHQVNLYVGNIMHFYPDVHSFPCSPDWYCSSFTKIRIHWNSLTHTAPHFFLSAMSCMSTNTYSHRYSFKDCVCLIDLEGWGLIHSQLWAHMVQASLRTPGSMRISTIIPVQVQGSPRAELKHSSPSPKLSPQATYITYWTPHNNEGRRGTCVFLFPFEEVPLCSPKDDLSPWGPNLPDSIVCGWVSVRGQCIYERVRRCVGVRMYKGQSLSMAHLWWNLI